MKYYIKGVFIFRIVQVLEPDLLVGRQLQEPQPVLRTDAARPRQRAEPEHRHGVPHGGHRGVRGAQLQLPGAQAGPS